MIVRVDNTHCFDFCIVNSVIIVSPEVPIDYRLLYSFRCVLDKKGTHGSSHALQGGNKPKVLLPFLIPDIF